MNDGRLCRASLRVALALVLAGYAALVILGLELRDSGPSAAVDVHQIAYVDECGRVRPEILDGVVIKGGTVRPKKGGVV